ncbi:MAG: peroxiredoxin [Pseudomonadota bacterium]
MMLSEGDKAPSFSLQADDGSEVSIDDLLQNGPLILYFYPADFTAVCTAEACSIRDMHADISDSGFNIVGVSPQSVDSHRRFKTRHDLPFRLLYDKGKRVIRAFGVDGPMGFGVRRATFLIGEDRTILGRVVSDLFVGNHTDFIRQAIAGAPRSAD